jgi:transketolase
MVAVRDKFGQSGKPAELLKLYGLTADNIVQKARLVLRQKSRIGTRGGALGRGR